MWYRLRSSHRAAIALVLGAPLAALAQRGAGAADQPGGGRATWDVTQARGKTRDIDFTTAEGTWMSGDLSPDRSWIAFDLLGHIYKIGRASCRERV